LDQVSNVKSDYVCLNHFE